MLQTYSLEMSKTCGNFNHQMKKKEIRPWRLLNDQVTVSLIAYSVRFNSITQNCNVITEDGDFTSETLSRTNTIFIVKKKMYFV